MTHDKAVIEIAYVLQEATKAPCPIAFWSEAYSGPTGYGELFAKALIAAGYRKSHTINPTNQRTAMPEVADSFIAARLTDSGATIEQFKGGQITSIINLEPGQVQFVIDQLSGAQ